MPEVPDVVPCLLPQRMAKQWDADANHQLHPKLSVHTITPGSNYKVAWHCSTGSRPEGCQHDHKWLNTVNNRSRGDGCPFCSGHRVCPCTSLAALPHSAEWHPSRNGDMQPDTVARNNDKLKVTSKSVHILLTFPDLHILQHMCLRIAKPPSNIF